MTDAINNGSDKFEEVTLSFNKISDTGSGSRFDYWYLCFKGFGVCYISIETRYFDMNRGTINFSITGYPQPKYNDTYIADHINESDKNIYRVALNTLDNITLTSPGRYVYKSIHGWYLI